MNAHLADVLDDFADLCSGERMIVYCLERLLHYVCSGGHSQGSTNLSCPRIHRDTVDLLSTLAIRAVLDGRRILDDLDELVCFLGHDDGHEVVYSVEEMDKVVEVLL